MKSVQLTANAKINLALAVKYKRDDGYHELELIFQEIDLSDSITLEKSDQICFSSNNPLLGPAEDNLCVKAAQLISKEFGLGGLTINLEKRIPVGGGLGGGSSDAAAVLKGGLKLYGRVASLSDLVRLAAKLGSDVPFFIRGKAAYGTGRGELLKPIKLPTGYKILLIIPSFGISTIWAYKNLNLALTSKYTDYKFRGFRFQNINLSEFKTEFNNEFEKTVFEAYPELASIKKKLYASGAVFAAMSGSGAVMFGLFDSDEYLSAAHKAMKAHYACHIARPL